MHAKKLYVNSTNHPSDAAKQIYKAAKENETEIILAANNQPVLDNSGLKLTNFIAFDSLEEGDNEASILTLLEYGKFKMLFTGDSGIKTFEKLKQYLPRDITVLKVGHHGAIGVVNREMVKYLNPEISLISTGENKFGHPAVYTLELLRKTQILRTDVNNSVRFVVNKDGYRVLTYDINRKKYVRRLLVSRE